MLRVGQEGRLSQLYFLDNPHPAAEIEDPVNFWQPIRVYTTELVLPE